MALHLVTAPTEEPISRDEAKAHLRLDTSSGALIESMCIALGTYTTTATGTTIDRAGYSASFVFLMTAMGANDNPLVLTVQHSTDNSTWEDVSTTWLDDASADQSTFSDADLNEVYTFAYTGDRRYVRVVATFGGTAPFSATFHVNTVLQSLSTDENDLVDGLIIAARRMCETYTKRVLVQQKWNWKFRTFPYCYPACLQVPIPPLITGSTSTPVITYVASDGTSTTIASSDYTVSTPYRMPGRIEPVYGRTWPTPRQEIDAVTVAFWAGYGPASSVPDALKVGIKLVIEHLFTERSWVNVGNIVNEMPAVKALWNTERWGL